MSARRKAEECADLIVGKEVDVGSKLFDCRFRSPERLLWSGERGLAFNQQAQSPFDLYEVFAL
jgi:hypothetical protein